MTDAPQGAAADLATPLTPAEQAVARIAELKADPDFVKRHVDGDHQTKAELARLHEIAFQPTANSIISGAPSHEQQWGEVADHLSLAGDLSAGVIEEIRRGQPGDAETYRLAVNRKRSRMSDPSWVAKYLNNGADERREMLLLNSIISRGMRFA
jgi:hypothetical protein